MSANHRRAAQVREAYYAGPDRPPNSAHRGRPVLTPEGRFPTVMQAARAHGLSKSTAHQRARKGIFGWRFEGPPK